MEEGLSGDVDFDFFDEGGDKSPDTKNQGKSPTHSTVNGKPPIPSPAKTPTNVKHGESSRTTKEDGYSSDESEKSYSSDYDSDDDRGTPRKVNEVKTIQARLPSADSGGRRNSPHVKKHRQSRSDSDSDTDSVSNSSDSESEKHWSDSSSAYSRSKYDSADKNSDTEQLSEYKKSIAWSEKTEEPENNENKAPEYSRPKTAAKRMTSKRMSRNHRSKGGSDTDSDSYTSDSDASSYSSKSDSEITDVSPLQTPDSSPAQRRKHNKHVAVISAPRKQLKQYTELPLENDDQIHHRPAEGTMEFKLLMQAVAELDSEKQKRLKASSRRVMFAPANPTQNRDKNNYSFTNSQTRTIDNENERLLQQIIRKRLPCKNKEVKVQIPRRMPNSAVNRLKEQRRIEQENLALLQRLQGIRPSKGITRNEQLTEYHRQMQYGVPRLRTKSANSNRSMGRTRSVSSMSTLHSGMTSPCSSSGTHSRPQSAKKFTAESRPAWEERW